ncbi:hypothetical protein [Pantanalinema sp. GBBB05]|uniref:hypothetical protein n=1 Tax=Pantanalinema sp. GBBB05 TaxID=2604139 RepID=UPI001DD87729|nr:hypothetical protein [Pantanalinema sp. GBBB05]
MTLKSTKDQARTRLLLTLWELGGTGTAVKKSELLDKTKRKGETSGDYQEFFEELSEKGAIALRKEKQTVLVSSAADAIANLLQIGLQDEEFEFKANVGKNRANALLRLIRALGQGASAPVAQPVAAKTISSYEEFKPVALEVFDRLNRDFNMDNLVPIYRIRREIGDRVTRSQFNDWLFSMQSDDIFQLLEESVEDAAPDKIEDSVTTKLGKLRCYVKRLPA